MGVPKHEMNKINLDNATMVENEFKKVKNTKNADFYKHAIYYTSFNMFIHAKRVKPKGEIEIHKHHLLGYYIDVIAKI